MMTFAEATDEQDKVSAACEALDLDGQTTDFVLASYRFNPSLLHTLLEHGADHRAYVELKLILLASQKGWPEPTFPPRLAQNSGESCDG